MRRALIVPAVTGLMLALTACGGGSGSTTAAPAPGAAAPTTPASDAPATSGTSGSSSGSDVCDLLPVSDVSRITGVHFTKTKSSSALNLVYGCEYSDAKYDLLQVTLTVSHGSTIYDSDLQALSSVGHGPTPVSGVGDKAFATPDPNGNAGAVGAASFASYGALFGDQYVKIGGSYVTPEQGRQLVEEVHGGL